MKKEIDIELNADFYLAVIVAILILAGIWATNFYLSVKLILTAFALCSFREFNYVYGSKARQEDNKDDGAKEGEKLAAYLNRKIEEQRKNNESN